jgi:hypothetical protein
MSENKKSFFSSIPGVITGLAGLLTGIVGLVTVLIQLDVIGGDDDSGPIASGGTTTVAPAAGGPAAGGTVTTTIKGGLSVQPTPVKLQPNEREKVVTVKNDASAAVTVLRPRYTGESASAFSTDAGCTNVALRPGASCTMKVQLSASGPLKVYKANLVVEADELGGVTEVPVEASTIL